MANTYEDYLETPKSLTFEQMKELHKELLAEIENDTIGQELYEELIGEAIAYAKIRAEWMHIERSQKMEQDSFRTSCHNSVITHFNMMARYLKTKGKPAKWRDALGYEENDRYFRKTIGDFGCYLVFIDSLCAR